MSNIHIDIDNLDFKQLKELLKEVRLYRDLKKQLWNRGKVLYKKLENGTNTLVVEYFSAMSEDLAWEESKKVFNKVFSLDLNRDEVTLLKNDNLKWWIKVYVNDKVMDLSYDRVERMVRK